MVLKIHGVLSIVLPRSNRKAAPAVRGAANAVIAETVPEHEAAGLDHARRVGLGLVELNLIGVVDIL